ncbi:MAG: sulfite exporter TauE/SafE family protein [Gammaproteobacteria bacterium]|nr:sulfite exporter TauE/SafE family protein [Gammaproteobacteria bacterium]
MEYFVLLLMICVMAMLYSSVGHGGASGYLAAMALFGLAPEVMKPAALTMNLFVASLVLVRLYRADYFSWRIFLPIAIASMPMAFWGGTLTPGDSLFQYIMGAALMLASFSFFIRVSNERECVEPTLSVSLPVGGVLGFISGLTGVGGGIYLSPLLLWLRWTQMRTNAAIAAAFILVNSAAGLAGHMVTVNTWPDDIGWYVIAALVGAVVGSELAVRRLAPPVLRQLLGVVLVIAGAKMLLTV